MSDSSKTVKHADIESLDQPPFPQTHTFQSSVSSASVASSPPGLQGVPSASSFTYNDMTPEQKQFYVNTVIAEEVGKFNSIDDQINQKEKELLQLYDAKGASESFLIKFLEDNKAQFINQQNKILLLVEDDKKDYPDIKHIKEHLSKSQHKLCDCQIEKIAYDIFGMIKFENKKQKFLVRQEVGVRPS